MFTELERRVGFLDAVVFSGGEPTAHAALGSAIEYVRDLGFEIGLHTAGIYPARLQAVIGHVDWVGFDVKAPLDERYAALTRTKNAHINVLESLSILRSSGVAFQIRTTDDPRHFDPGVRHALAQQLKVLGHPPTHWQSCRP